MTIDLIGLQWAHSRASHEAFVANALSDLADGDALASLSPGARLASEAVRLRTYARIKSDGARETWRETVIRWGAYMRHRMYQQIAGAHDNKSARLIMLDAFDEKVVEAIRAVFLRDVMPSMRGLWAAGDVLEVNDLASYNCLGVETEFITDQGVRSFADFNDGDTVRVLTHTGAYKPAVVRCFGEQRLYKIRFSRGRGTVTVRATADHQWLLADGSRTTNLRVGDAILPPPEIVSRWDYATAPENEKIAWARGFVYGDGTLLKNSRGEYHQSAVRLCGNKMRFFDRFKALGCGHCSPPSFNGDALLYFGSYLKTLPEGGAENIAELTAFIRGYLDADGAVNYKEGREGRFLSIQSSNEDGIEFIRSMFPSVGCYVTAERDLTGQTTNYGTRPTTSFFGLSQGFYPGTSGNFRAREIVEDAVEPVWCLVVEDDHSFVLPSGLVTGNCAFAPADSPAIFSEALFVLMQGTGFGFSVERKFVSKLPQPAVPQVCAIPRHVIEDSTDGWRRATAVGVRAWFMGGDVDFDYSRIRPEGTPLKTKGGEASGPEPLRKYLMALREAIRTAGYEQRKLAPVEVHDLLCLAGSIVQVGGVRRSAMISFSDRDDNDMRWAKHYPSAAANGTTIPEQRYQANNSWVIEPGDEVTWTDFSHEWEILRSSGAGERGIVNTTRALYRGVPVRGNPCMEIWLAWLDALEMASKAGDYSSGGGQLCVAGDTPLITREGLTTIKDAVGKPVHIWNGEKWAKVQPFQTGTDQPLFRVKFSDGSHLDCTGGHRFLVSNIYTRNTKQAWREMTTAELAASVGDKTWATPQFRMDLADGTSVPYAYDLGVAIGDGYIQRRARKNFTSESVHVALMGAKIDKIPLEGVRHKRRRPAGYAVDKQTVRCVTVPVAEMAAIRADASALDAMFTWSRESILAFIAGWLDTDGSKNGKGGVRLYLSGEEHAKKVQLLLTRCGIRSSISLFAEEGAVTNYGTRSRNLYYICITDCADIPCKRLDTSGGHAPKFKSKYQTIRSIEALPGLHDTYCFEESERHMGVFNNTLTFQCNLSNIVLRPHDNGVTALRKADLAAFIGTMQACLTNFPGVRKGWEEVTRRDALLGVGLAGQVDALHISTNEATLTLMNACVERANLTWAARFGINEAAGLTCGKPDGNSSVFLGCSSGVHAHHALFYIRRFQVSARSPVCALLRAAGVPCIPTGEGVAAALEAGSLAPEAVGGWTFEVPVRAPEGAFTREDETAIQMLERIDLLNRSWLAVKGHNQSATVNVREHEWDEVGAWVFEHLDKIGGLSFFPYDDHVYYGAPLEEITEAEYEARLAALPTVDWSRMASFENGFAEGQQTFACTSGACSIV